MMPIVGLATFATLLALAVGFSAGPPPGACTDATMTPTGHGANAQSSIAPYTITVAGMKSQFASGDKVKVTIAGAVAGKTFMGFFVQMRGAAAADQDTQFGTWSAPIGGSSICNSKAVGHTSPSVKTSVDLEWTASVDATKNVQVVATFVETKLMFWTKVKGPTLEYNATAPTTQSTTTLAPTTKKNSATHLTSQLLFLLPIFYLW